MPNSPLRNRALIPDDPTLRQPLEADSRPDPTGALLQPNVRQYGDFRRGLGLASSQLSAGSDFNKAIKLEAQGDPEFRTYRDEGIRATEQAQLTGPSILDIREINNLQDAMTWAKGGAGQVIPTMLPSIAGGAAGRALTRSTAGAYLGALPPAYTMERNEAFSDQYMDPELADKPISDRLAAGRVKGAAAGAMEAVVPGIAVNTIFRGAAAGAGSRIGRAMAMEAATEASQETIGFGARKYLDPNQELDPWEVANAAALGALGGGMAQTGAEGVTRIKPAMQSMLDARYERRMKGLEDAFKQVPDGPKDLPPTPEIQDVDEFIDLNMHKSPDVVAESILHPERDPSLRNKSDEELGIELEKRDAYSTVAVQKMAESLLNDPKIPDSIKAEVENLAGTFDQGDTQASIAKIYMQQKAINGLQSSIETLSKTFDGLKGKITRSNRQTLGLKTPSNRDLNTLQKKTQESLEADKKADTKPGAVVGKRPVADGMPIPDADIANMTQVLAPLLGSRADEAPMLARQIYTLAARVPTSGELKLAGDLTSLKELGLANSDGKIPLSKIQALTGLDRGLQSLDPDGLLIDMMKKSPNTKAFVEALSYVRQLSSAYQDTNTHGEKSFLYSMLTPEARQTASPAVLNKLAGMVDENFDLGKKNKEQRAGTINAFAKLFGSEARAQVVLDHYGALRRAAFGREAESNVLADDRPESLYGTQVVDESRTKSSKASEEVDADHWGMTKQDFQLGDQKMSAVDTPEGQYFFQRGDKRLPFLRGDTVTLSDGRTRTRAQQMARHLKSKFGPSNVKLLRYGKFIQEQGLNATEEVKHIQTNVRARLKRAERELVNLENKGKAATVAGNDTTKLREQYKQKKKEIDVLKGQDIMLSAVTDDVSAGEVLNSLYNVVKVSGQEENHLAVSDAMLERMRSHVDNSSQVASRITFKMASGNPMTLNAVSMWKTIESSEAAKSAVSEKREAYIRRLFKEALIGVLMRPDVVGLTATEFTQADLKFEGNEANKKSPVYKNRLAMAHGQRSLFLDDVVLEYRKGTHNLMLKPFSWLAVLRSKKAEAITKGQTEKFMKLLEADKVEFENLNQLKKKLDKLVTAFEQTGRPELFLRGQDIGSTKARDARYQRRDAMRESADLTGPAKPTQTGPVRPQSDPAAEQVSPRAPTSKQQIRAEQAYREAMREKITKQIEDLFTANFEARKNTKDVSVKASLDRQLSAIQSAQRKIADKQWELFMEEQQTPGMPDFEDTGLSEQARLYQEETGESLARQRLKPMPKPRDPSKVDGPYRRSILDVLRQDYKLVVELLKNKFAGPATKNRMLYTLEEMEAEGKARVQRGESTTIAAKDVPKRLNALLSQYEDLTQQMDAMIEFVGPVSKAQARKNETLANQWMKTRVEIQSLVQMGKGPVKVKRGKPDLPETGNRFLSKDKAKWAKANKFIGRGSPGSSTQAYADGLGPKWANTGSYTSTDVVFISAEGNRYNRLDFDKAELDKALNAGATIITDSVDTGRRRSHNVGEREVADYLQTKGYVESAPGTWTKAKITRSNKQAAEIHEQLGREGFAAAHNSPHKFDVFNWRKHFRSGEGGTAYGAGVNVSTANAVFKHYKDYFTAKLHGEVSPSYHLSIKADAKTEIMGWNTPLPRMDKAIQTKLAAAFKERGLTMPEGTEADFSDGRTIYNMLLGTFWDKYRATAERTRKGSNEAIRQAYIDTSDLLMKHGIVGHKFASDNSSNMAEPNYVIYDDSRITQNFVEFNKQKPKKGRPAKLKTNERDDLIADLRKIRGPELKVIIEKTFGQMENQSGEFSADPDFTNRVIEIAINAANPRAIGMHEAMHDFFLSLRNNDDPQVRRLITSLNRMADAPHVIEQLRQKLAGDQAALDQLKNREERMAYAFQYYMTDPSFKITPATRSFFQKLVQMIRELLGIVSQYEQAEQILLGLRLGNFAYPALDNVPTNQQTQEARVEAYREQYRELTALIKKLEPQLAPLRKKAEGDTQAAKDLRRLNDRIESLLTKQGDVAEKARIEQSGIAASKRDPSAPDSEKLRAARKKQKAEYRKQVRDEFGKLSPTAGQRVEQLAPWLYDGYMKMLASSTDRLHGLNYGPLDEIADRFFRHAKHGDHLRFGKQVGEDGEGSIGFLQERHRREYQYLNEVYAITRGMSEAETSQLHEELITDRIGPQHQKATQIRQIYKDLFKYMQDAGVMRQEADPESGKLMWKPLREMKHYHHRKWNAAAIRRDPDLFISRLEEAGYEGVIARAITESMMAGDGRIDMAESPRHLGFIPFNAAVQERALTKINAGNIDQFTDFIDTDFINTISTYVRQAVHRAEYARAFGNDGEWIQNRLEEARAAGMSDKDMATAVKAIQALEGTLHQDLSAKVKNLQAAALTIQNVILLPMAVFTMAVDPLGIAIRTGKMADAGTAYVQALRAMKKTIMRDKSRNWAEEMADFVGVTSRTAMLEAYGQVQGSMYMSHAFRRVNQIFFKYNGMEGLTNAWRVGALEAGNRWIKENIDNQAALEEVGLSRADVFIAPENNLAIKPDEIFAELKQRNPKGKNKTLQAEADKISLRVQQAMFRFIDSTIIRPNAAHRPVWMSDPRFMLVAHLKQFATSFQTVILQRVSREMLINGKTAPGFMLMAYMPVMLASDIARWTLTPVTPSLPDNWSFFDFFSHSLFRSGILGKGEFGADIVGDLQRGKLPGESLIGPTAEHTVSLAQWIAGDPRTTAQGIAKRTLPGLRYFI